MKVWSGKAGAGVARPLASGRETRSLRRETASRSRSTYGWRSWSWKTQEEGSRSVEREEALTELTQGWMGRGSRQRANGRGLLYHSLAKRKRKAQESWSTDRHRAQGSLSGTHGHPGTSIRGQQNPDRAGMNAVRQTARSWLLSTAQVLLLGRRRPQKGRDGPE